MDSQNKDLLLPFKTLFIFIFHLFKTSSFLFILSRPQSSFQDLINAFKTSFILSRPHLSFQDLIHPFKTSFVLSRPHSCFQILIHAFKILLFLSRPHSSLLTDAIHSFWILNILPRRNPSYEDLTPPPSLNPVYTL